MFGVQAGVLRLTHYLIILVYLLAYLFAFPLLLAALGSEGEL